MSTARGSARILQALQQLQFAGRPHGPCIGFRQEDCVMAEPLRQYRETETIVPAEVAVREVRAYGAYRMLYALFVLLPLAAGLDKFTHLLVNWDQYLAPTVTEMLPAGVGPHVFMLAVGVVEIVAGLIVAAKPSVG